MRRLVYLLWAVVGILCFACAEDEWKPEETQPPIIIDFTPKEGPAGTQVVITGTDFGATITANVVKFNGKLAPISSASSTEINVSVPAGATTGKIEVTTGKRTVVSASDFTVQ